MAPVTFYLVSLASSLASDGFVPVLKALPPTERPLWAAACLHWIHEPHFSVEALAGAGDKMQDWTYLVIYAGSNTGLPPAVAVHASSSWSIVAEVQDAMIETLTARKVAMTMADPPALPSGWSAEKHDGIDSAATVPGVEISLHTTSRPFRGEKLVEGQPLKTIVRDLGIARPGPVAMLNLLSYLPGQRPRYLQYMAAFQDTIGPKYGGQPLLLGLGVSDWSSRQAEKVEGHDDGQWEDVGLIWYPSVWHFGKMLDDPVYAELDRKYKGGVLKDNPIICCSELDLGC